MSKRWTAAVVGVMVVALVDAVGLAGVTGRTRADPSSSWVADATEFAVRGTPFQITPFPPPPPPPPAVCTPGSLIRGVNVGSTKVVAFSFDDGPWPTNTRAVMSAFEARGLRATFFWPGINVNAYPDIARDVVTRGHEVGNHSQTHVYSPSTIAREIPIANATIARVTGVTPVLFRSPGLTQSDTIQSALAVYGMCNIFTTVVLGDHLMPRRSASTLCSSFANTLHPGEIVLLHDGGSHTPTVQAVPCMLDTALRRGYQIVTVGQLLRLGVPYSGPRPRTS
jgi:peptidoglycan/xylan/chitin deacetylase (PgdA/CDA1 family)